MAMIRCGRYEKRSLPTEAQTSRVSWPSGEYDWNSERRESFLFTSLEILSCTAAMGGLLV